MSRASHLSTGCLIFAAITFIAPARGATAPEPSAAAASTPDPRASVDCEHPLDTQLFTFKAGTPEVLVLLTPHERCPGFFVDWTTSVLLRGAGGAWTKVELPIERESAGTTSFELVRTKSADRILMAVRLTMPRADNTLHRLELYAIEGGGARLLHTAEGNDWCGEPKWDVDAAGRVIERARPASERCPASPEKLWVPDNTAESSHAIP